MANDSTCTTEGCTRGIEIKARGLCRPCYTRLWRANRLKGEVRKGRMPEDKRCDEPGCGNRHKALGYCKKHLEEARRDGRLPAQLCDFDGCGRVVHIQQEGLCLGHLRQKRRGKPLTPIARRQKREGTCNGPKCTRDVQAKGYCSGHYYQFSNGLELAPLKQVEEGWQEKPCKVCAAHGEKRPSYTSENLCRVHARRKASEEEEWDRPVPQKAPNGAGHINEDGYRIITVNGRNVSEHRHVIEQLLGRQLRKAENVHHLNGNRADNRTDGPLQLVNGKLRSGNLELWSTAQPAGQEIGPKVEWALELLGEYAGFLTDEHRESLRAVLARG